jgi:hypothetical protein
VNQHIIALDHRLSPMRCTACGASGSPFPVNSQCKATDWAVRLLARWLARRVTALAGREFRKVNRCN